MTIILCGGASSAARSSVLAGILLFFGSNCIAGVTLTISPSARVSTVGAQLSFDVEVSGLGNGTALGTYDLEVGFDPAVLSYVGTTFGSQLNLSGLGDEQSATPGTATVELFELSLDSAAMLNSRQSPSFGLATLAFSAVGMSNSSAITLSVNAFGDASGISIPVSIQNGAVTVVPAPVVSPTISVGGVVTASAFGAFKSVSPGSWIEIYGSNLAVDQRSWNGFDFTGLDAPTKLDGTSVTVGGQAAFIDFISPGQVNALVPSNVATGVQDISVTTAAGTSSPLNIMINAVEPGLLSPQSFNLNGVQYAVALFGDGTYVLPTGAIAGLNSRPAKAGETIVLYGIGFGPVIPEIEAGQLVNESNTLASVLEISIAGMAATLVYSGLAPNYTGLYQFNITVPNGAAPGNAALTFSLAGVNGVQALYIPVQN